MNFAMIAIDLDGTLLSPRGQVTPRTKAAVHGLLRSGMRICFATGRNFVESRKVLQSVNHFDTAVFVSGAMVVDTTQPRTLYRRHMGGELARQVCSFFESAGHCVLALQESEPAGVDYLMSEGIEPDVATTAWLKATASSVRRASDLTTHAHQHTMRVGIVAKSAVARALDDQIRDALGPRIVSHCLYVPGSDATVIEVFDPAVNKWEGISFVARHYGIDPRRIIAVGDDVNDIAMVRNAGLGVAMGNARPELLAAAQQVIGSNSEDGLAMFLEQLAKAA